MPRVARIAWIVALGLLGCNRVADLGPDAGVPDLLAAPDAGVCGAGVCAVDFPCANGSVCSATGVQSCTTTLFNGGPSPECSKMCEGPSCCTCCEGGTCTVGALAACPPGTVCMEHFQGENAFGGPSLEAACQSLDGGIDLAGWTQPTPDAGHTCYMPAY